MPDNSGTPNPAPAPKSSLFHYLAGMACGTLVGYVAVRVEDLLLTAVLVASSCMLLAFLRPAHPWRWALLVPAFIPIGLVLAHKLAGQRVTHLGISEAFFALFPSIAGAVLGAVMRRVIRELWPEK